MAARVLLFFARLDRRSPMFVVCLSCLAVLGCRRPAEVAPLAFHAALSYDLTTLDPHVEATVSSSLLYNVYEALVAVDGNFEIRPGLAESWTTPDELTWHLRLRSSVRFHSGKVLEAADVAYTLERIRGHPELESGYYLIDVVGVRALDDRTVELKTRQPSPILLNRLSFVPMVPAGGSDLAQAADGTGPFRVVSWTKGKRLDLRRHESYWGKSGPIEHATFWFGKSKDEISQGLLGGEYQLGTLGPGEPDPRVTQSRRLTILRGDAFYVKYLAFDLARDETPFSSVRPNPFKDRRVREAIHYALDRPRLVAGSPGAVPATQLVPRSVLGFAPDLPVVLPDRDHSRALLAQAGLGSGLRATLHARGSLADAAEGVREQLGAVGIALDVRVLSDPDYWGAVDRSATSLWIGRWGCTTVDAGELFENAMHSPSPGLGLGLYNRTGHQNAALDRAIEESRGVYPRSERRDALQRLMRSVMDELYWVPLFADQEGYALDARFSWQPRYSVRLAEVQVARP